jgi:hypothetical protein
MLIDVSTRRFGRPVWLREVDVPANRCWGFEIGVRGGGSWRFRRRGCEFMATVLSNASSDRNDGDLAPFLQNEPNYLDLFQGLEKVEQLRNRPSRRPDRLFRAVDCRGSALSAIASVSTSRRR